MAVEFEMEKVKQRTTYVIFCKGTHVWPVKNFVQVDPWPYAQLITGLSPFEM